MNISTILDHIDSGHMALPEFQRGYVWNRDQVRGLIQSLYHRYPVGSLLVWATQSEDAEYRGDGTLAPGVVKLLLDGQQRITSLYGIIRGEAPEFFDGNEQAFTGLRFHLDTEEFAFYSPVKMADDLIWIDVSQLMKEGLAPFIQKLNAVDELHEFIGTYMERLNRVHSIRDIKFHVEEVTGKDMTIDVVVEIFNRVNSGGTKLSKGDLALAKICAESPDARVKMKAALEKWKEAGYQFNLDWLLRNVNTVITGEAKFEHMHSLNAEEFHNGLARAEKAVDYLLNAISGRLGLDHDRVFFGRYAVPVMAHYLDRRGGHLEDVQERDRILYWYLHNAMWGRYSASTESIIDKDLKAVEEIDKGLDRLIKELQLWRGSLKVLPDHFGGWSLGARFYPMLYLLTRVGEARDWGTGLALKSDLLGKMNKLEVHHIFPKAFLYKHDFGRAEVNAIANFCFLTKETNLQILDSPPEVYFPKIEEKHPGALASQWVPMDSDLWKVENYLDFLEARKELLAEAANSFLRDLLHDSALADEVEKGPVEEIAIVAEAPAVAPEQPPGGVESEEEEELLLACNLWVLEQKLPEGQFMFELADDETGQPLAIFDLAWPDGLQAELSQPVAVLIDERAEVLEIANAHGFLYFTSIDSFKQYVRQEILAMEESVEAA